MGLLHDAKCFTELTIKATAMIEEGKGYEAADGSLKMPSYSGLITVQELIDLVAYLKGLRLPTEPAVGHGSGPDSPSGCPGH